MARVSLLTMIAVGAVSLLRLANSLVRNRGKRSGPRPGKTRKLTKAEREQGIKLNPKGIKYLVDPKELVRGVPAKDAIAAIDNPKFTSAREAAKWLKGTDLVLGIDYQGEPRAYPLRIMAWHEIVNDTIAGEPMLVTYCPLCSSGIAYERKLNGQAVKFGVSGKLYNSNLVMYDEKTGTYWSQFDGRAIIGELAGQELTLAPVPLVTTYWREWRKQHPDTKVLSKDTGFLIKLYGADPYSGYYRDSLVMFGAREKGRPQGLHPKKVVFGIQVKGAFKAYRADDIKAKTAIKDTLGGEDIRLEKDTLGGLKVTNLKTGEDIPSERTFWFAWHAFHPDTEIYNP